ncbi:MAG: HD domain-containing protein [Syntrophobacteraceae bacterium]|jgi:putative nucleotidyltransferase with HDIG domain|nr:HD domain-containing protein [Syntrophobacteraceae bacterium]
MECESLLERVQMPRHIQLHSMLVAEVAVFLGTLLNNRQTDLDLQLLEAGGLLHDIAKPRSIATGERHEELGAVMLRDWGYPMVAHIVREHVTMDHGRIMGPVNESILVNYADKRVRHTEIVSIEARFLDLIDRYARSREQAVFLEERMGLYFRLEERIFERLPISPTGEELMAIQVSIEAGEEGGGNGECGKTADGGAAGWREIGGARGIPQKW